MSAARIAAWSFCIGGKNKRGNKSFLKKFSLGLKPFWEKQRSMRGFVSFVLLVLIASVGVSQYALQSTHHTPITKGMEIQTLAANRSQLEQGMDRIISEELRTGMQQQLPSEQIKTHINSALALYLYEEQQQILLPMRMQAGFAAMQTTQYLSLAQAPLQPLSTQTLNAYSHVFVLPLNQTQQYGEYTYTGGAFGTNILLAKLTTEESTTIAALPSGYRICVLDTIGEVPCAVG